MKPESIFVYATERGQYYCASAVDNFKRKSRISRERFEKARSIGQSFYYKNKLAWGW